MKFFLILIVCFLFIGSGLALGVELSHQTSEQEKLYRYFGAAAGLREEGKFEEAVEILQYILDKNPHNDYIRTYLESTKNEMRKEKGKWNAESKEGAASLKKKKIKELTQEGIDSYRREDFDGALLRFSDVLSLDSGNVTAKEYMEKLKKHYAKELKIANLAQGKIGLPLKGVMDKVQLKYLALDKRANRLLNQAELGLKVEEIIAAEKAEDRRSAQLTLGPGDLVEISILDHPELSGDVTVRVNGEIILPLVNDSVIAENLTLEELSEEVKKTMKRYVQDPRVNISAIEYKSKRYYVIDEVGCTPYPITRADFTLRDALFTADWGDNRALGRVILTKPSKKFPIVKKVNGFDLVYRGKLEDDVRIEDGDIIYIPMTVAAKVTKTIRDLLGPFSAIRQARDNYLNLKWNEKDWKGVIRLPVDYDAQTEDSKDVRLENISLYDYIVTR